MEFKLALIFITLALASAEECGEKKSEECMDILLNLMMMDDDATDEEGCGKLLEAAACVQEAADLCEGDPRQQHFVSVREEIHKGIDEHCDGLAIPLPQDDEMEKCFNENSEYILQCIPESFAKLQPVFGDADEIDMDEMKCAMFKLMSKCLTTKATEKCGDEAGKKIAELSAEFMRGSDMSETCTAQSSLSIFTNQLLEKRRRRK